MSWRLARSLDQLRHEANALAPRRSKRSDGTIGDAAHRLRCSRHNPNNHGVVCALDLTHDPAGGFDAHQAAETIRRLAAATATNPNVEYIISNRRICSRSNGWRWVAYGGSNPHTAHVHFAVGLGNDCEPWPPYDDPSPWGIAKPAPPRPVPSPGGVEVQLPLLKHGDGFTSTGRQDLRGAVLSLQSLANIKAGQGIAEDGRFGDETKQAIVNIQRFFRIEVDGVVGGQTWPTLFL